MPGKKNKEVETNENEYEAKYIKIGFRKLFKPDQKMPTFPTEVSQLGYAELSDHCAVYQAWREFAEDVVRALNTQLILAQQDYDLKYAEQMVATVVPGNKITDKKFMVDSNPKVVTVYNKYLSLQIEKDMYQSKVESFTNSLAVLSREITLRQNTQPNAR